MAESARGAAVPVAGDRLRLAEAPGEIWLAGVIAPRGRANLMAAPFAATSRDVLAQILDGHQVSIRPAGLPDRGGRIRAEVIRDDGLWIQAALLRAGAVRVALAAEDAALADPLFAAEAEARTARQGLWRQTAYAVRDAGDLARLNRDVGTYQVVAGVIANTARRGDFIYLNFGDDYRTDTTAVIPRAAWTAFGTRRLMKLSGHRIEFRGWVNRHNGPEIELTVPAMLIARD